MISKEHDRNFLDWNRKAGNKTMVMAAIVEINIKYSEYVISMEMWVEWDWVCILGVSRTHISCSGHWTQH